jgi:hypothetical protein
MFAFRSRIGILLLIAGGFLIYLGVQEWQLSKSASAEPEAITLQALVARGPTGNPHVLVSNYDLDEDRLVYEAAENNAPTGWTRVWVPVAPSGEAQPGQPFPVQAVIRSKRVHSAPDVHLLQPTVHGVVVNGIESLGREEKKLLEEVAPGTDVSRCLIIDDDRSPSNAGSLAGYLGGGGALAVVGLLLLVWGVRGRAR